MKQEELMLKIENVSKIYKLGEIGGTTLRDELQRVWAKLRKKEDPTKKIGAKNYNKGEKFKALDNVSFEVKKGERIGIIGHNGAGKSTLLKLISRVTGPSEGKIFLNGRVASMLEVGTGFHPELTGRENVYMNGAILGMTKKEIDAKMEKIIEFSEVRQFIDTPVKRYSSGMYVKLAFAVAAHLDSEIMIMDEVLAVGDVQFQKKCLTKMRSISEEENRTILYVSHNMFTIRELCTRVIVLSEGKIIFDGDVDKGISIYANSNLPKQLKYDLSNKSKHEINVSGDVLITKVEFKQNFLSKDVPLEYDLTFKCEKDIENLCFRFVVMRYDGFPIATYLSSLTNYKGGKIYLEHFIIDTSVLSPDSYYVRIVVFKRTDIGTQLRQDAVDKVLYFDITDDLDRKNISWQSRYWGNISMPVLEHKILEVKDTVDE